MKKLIFRERSFLKFHMDLFLRMGRDFGHPLPFSWGFLPELLK